jgi:hypothetical protein
VLAGGSVHARAGEIFLPTHEYFAGMDCPWANASLVNLKDMFASVVGSSVAGDVVADVIGSVVADSGVTGLAVAEGVGDEHAEKSIDIKSI